MKSEQLSDLGKSKVKLQADKRISKDYSSAIRTKFSHGTDAAKRAFTKFVPADSEFQGVAHYDTVLKKVFMNYEADLHNPRGAGATWFHEHGHMIEDLAGEISNNTVFKDLLESDYFDYMKAYGKANKLGTFDKVQPAISRDLNDMRKHSAVSDILEGVSKGNIRGCAGHMESNPQYWERDGALTFEAFAHMYEAQFDSVRYTEMKKYFPKSLKYFENTLKEMIK